MDEHFMDEQAIVQYYEETESDYRLVWSLEKEKALHYGYWDETTWTFRQALRRTNEILAHWGQITENDEVLDAGCGVGGSAIFLAQKYGCKITGITLSPRQVYLAKKYAREARVTHKTMFLVANYLKMPFHQKSFDVVWAIESSCYSPDEKSFLREVKRVLRPGGRLIMTDFFRTKNRFDSRTLAHYRKWAEGWVVNEFPNIRKFRSALETFGFKNIQITEATRNIQPLAFRQYVAFFMGFLVRKLQWVFYQKSHVLEKNPGSIPSIPRAAPGCLAILHRISYLLIYPL